MLQWQHFHTCVSSPRTHLSTCVLISLGYIKSSESEKLDIIIKYKHISYMEVKLCRSYSSTSEGFKCVMKIKWISIYSTFTSQKYKCTRNKHCSKLDFFCQINISHLFFVNQNLVVELNEDFVSTVIDQK